MNQKKNGSFLLEESSVSDIRPSRASWSEAAPMGRGESSMILAPSFDASCTVAGSFGKADASVTNWSSKQVAERILRIPGKVMNGSRKHPKGQGADGLSPQVSPGSDTKVGIIEHRNSFELFLEDEEEVRLDALEDARIQVPVDHCGNSFVFREDHWLLPLWHCVVALGLSYIATFFLYQLVFLEFHIPEPIELPFSALVIMMITDVVFWIDFFATFFFTYRDVDNVEVDSLRRIAKNYMTSLHFYLNLFACLPSDIFESAFEGTPANKAARIMRLQRLSRLFRLVKLSKIVQLIRVPRITKCVRRLSTYRSVRLFNFILALFWCLHFLACGWYVCAVIGYYNPRSNTKCWLERRQLNSAGTENLMTNNEPLLQWLHSMYFVMTVFTTVGFGDIAAMTNVECVYVLGVFIITTVLSSIIMGELINICIREDEIGKYVAQQRHLVEAFADHLKFNFLIKEDLLSWVEQDSPSWMIHQYDRDAMKELIQGRFMPREMMAQLPARLYKGELAKSRLFTMLAERIEYLPPRFPIIFALSTYHKQMVLHEYVYQRQDLSNNIFMVISGTFAHIGIPGKNGGKDVRFFSSSGEDPQGSLFPYQLFSRKSYFGDEMLLNLHHRVASVRCEKAGWVLVVARRDLHKLIGRFPEFAAVWQKEARRREWHRQNLVAGFTAGHTFRHLACMTIQRFYRNRWGKTGTGHVAAIAKDFRQKFTVEAIRTIHDHRDTLISGPGESVATVDAVSVLNEIRSLRSDMITMGKRMQDEVANIRQQLNLRDLPAVGSNEAAI